MAVGRFQVMAVLQAARAELLGLPPDSAKSWGLNRAIYIAAAKRGFRGKPAGHGGTSKSAGRPAPGKFELGDDHAYSELVKGKRYFTIGGEIQTPEAFERQVGSRFGSSFPTAWDEAKNYVDGFPKEVLLSKEVFFRDVYRPKRDELAARWTDLAGTPPVKKPAWMKQS